VKNNRTLDYQLANIKNRRLEFNFKGGDVTSDGGSILLRQVDLKLGLTENLAKVIDDTRVKGQINHSQRTMLMQRIYGIALGYEDVNDHNFLRKDIGFQTAVGKDRELASASTICRFENRATRKWAWQAHKVLLNSFISSFKIPPKELILDFDATDDAVHGNQEGRFFHGYYDKYCFLPLYVFCGDQLLVAYLRESKIDGAKHSWAILSLLTKVLKKAWPEVNIVFRADSGFCRHRMFNWCEKHNIKYIVGLARNNTLKKKAESLMKKASKEYEKTGVKQRLFKVIKYAAKSWSKIRKVVAKAEYSERGPNPRYIVTNIAGWGEKLYDKIYCKRGEMENRIKEQQLHLFADRTSCTAWYPNQFRLLLSSFAYVLIETIRRLALTGTELAKAQCETIRLKLLKIGAVIIRNTRRIRFLMATGYPYQSTFYKAIEAFSSG
jgi:hypothetical protein